LNEGEKFQIRSDIYDVKNVFINGKFCNCMKRGRFCKGGRFKI